jgi:hypothetical protein
VKDIGTVLFLATVKCPDCGETIINRNELVPLPAVDIMAKIHAFDAVNVQLVRVSEDDADRLDEVWVNRIVGRMFGRRH